MLPIAALLAAASLAAPVTPAAAAFPPKIPFPPPKLAQVTDATKCDFGTVLSLDVPNGRLQGLTKAGPVTYVVSADVQVFAADGKPAGGVAAVATGAKYRAYYVLDGGAKVLEIDLVE